MSPRKTSKAKKKNNNGATLGIEAGLWQAVDKSQRYLGFDYMNGIIF